MVGFNKNKNGGISIIIKVWYLLQIVDLNGKTRAFTMTPQAGLFSIQSNVPKMKNNHYATKEEISSGSSSSSISDSMPVDMEAFASAYATPFEELPCRECTPTVGEIPDDLVGTYYRVGPAMFSAGSILPPKTSIVQPKGDPTPDGYGNGERMVHHPFDADGAILAVTFGNNDPDSDPDSQTIRASNTCTARYRYVRTNAFTNERRKGMRLYSGMDTTRDDESVPKTSLGLGNDFPLPMYRHHLQSGLNKKRKNTSNTRAIYWSKKLLTLWEGGLPYKLDALALSTEGRSQLGGVLMEASPFSSKACYDPELQRMLFYSNCPFGEGSDTKNTVINSNDNNSSSSTLTLYEFNSKFRLSQSTTINLPGYSLLSDFAITANHAIFVQPSIQTNSMQYLFNKDPSKILTLNDSKQDVTLLHLLSRNSKNQNRLKTIPIPKDSIPDAELQFINAYEVTQDNQNLIIMDVIRSDGKHIVQNNDMKWPWAKTLSQYQQSASRKTLWRYTIDLDTNQITKQQSVLAQNDNDIDPLLSFATINPEYSTKEYRYIYASIGAKGHYVSPPQGIAKIDLMYNDDTKSTTDSRSSSSSSSISSSSKMDAWFPQPHEFCGEPMYAPKKKLDNTEEEDSGYILSVLYNGNTKESEMIVLEAQDIAAGPIARIPMGISIPHGLYGCFASTEEANWSGEEIDRRAKLADKMESRGNMWNEVKSDFSGLGLRLDDWEDYFGDIL